MLVADKLAKKPLLLDRVKSLRNDGMDATDWDQLLQRAIRQWKEYFELTASRAPDDDRIEVLRNEPPLPGAESAVEVIAEDGGVPAVAEAEAPPASEEDAGPSGSP